MTPEEFGAWFESIIADNDKARALIFEEAPLPDSLSNAQRQFVAASIKNAKGIMDWAKAQSGCGPADSANAPSPVPTLERSEERQHKTKRCAR